jgi:hypothetical protein
MMEQTATKPLRGIKKVSNYQRLVIRTVLEKGSRVAACEHLGIPRATLDDAMYRAFRALNVTNITDANYLLTQGVTSRQADASTTPTE